MSEACHPFPQITNLAAHRDPSNPNFSLQHTSRTNQLEWDLANQSVANARADAIKYDLAHHNSSKKYNPQATVESYLSDNSMYPVDKIDFESILSHIIISAMTLARSIRLTRLISKVR
jgi:hypothetical protein